MRLFRSLAVFAVALPQALGQALVVNGQLFTRGLAIIDAPAANGTQHANGTVSIAIDVSGDGKLQANSSTNISSLNIYLISSTTQLNITVSNTTALLTGEPGSTVKHLNYLVPDCVPSGNYNLTFYEIATFQSKAYFTITPVFIPIQNAIQANADPTSCGLPTNALQTQPQPDAAIGVSPFLPPGTNTSAVPPTATGDAAYAHSLSAVTVLVSSVLAFALSNVF